MESSTDLRLRLAEALRQYDLKQVNVARETGIHNTTLSLWLRGKSKSNNEKIESKIEVWLQRLYSSRPEDIHNPEVQKYISRFHRITQHKVMHQDSESELIPIRLSLELKGRKLNESICWDTHEPYFTPASFADLLCEDLNLPGDFSSEITHAISQRIGNQHRYRSSSKECLKELNIELRMSNIILTDKILWDINNTSNSPEFFAQCVCADLGLGGEIVSALAHKIREQVLYYRKIEQSRGGFESEAVESLYRRSPATWGPQVKVTCWSSESQEQE